MKARKRVAKPVELPADAVAAIRAGKKTQMRMVMRPQPEPVGDSNAVSWRSGLFQPAVLPHNTNLLRYCPLGVAGDMLWVRERWGLFREGADSDHGHRTIEAAVKGEPPQSAEELGPGWKLQFPDEIDMPRSAWRTVRTMPFWAARLWLRIEAVRVQRLQDISDTDTLEEGVRRGLLPGLWLPCREPGKEHISQRLAFRDLWDSTHGRGNWATNPYVWAITFSAQERRP